MDYDLMDFVAQLREAILEAYTGIVTGFKNTDKGMGYIRQTGAVQLTVSFM